MLLDVNVLLALTWPNHQFHQQARAWFRRRAPAGWSTCAITQLGFIRLSSNPAFTEHAKTPAEAALVLARLTSRRDHRWLAELPPPERFAEVWRDVAGYRQTTDVYLACVAGQNRTRLATFDGRIRAIRALRGLVEVIA